MIKDYGLRDHSPRRGGILEFGPRVIPDYLQVSLTFQNSDRSLPHGEVGDRIATMLIYVSSPNSDRILTSSF